MKKRENNSIFLPQGLLSRSETVAKKLIKTENDENIASLKNLFNLFELPLEIIKVNRGQNITLFEIKAPEDFNLKEFFNKYKDDICVALSSPEIRFVEELLTEATFGIESINRLNNTITLGDLYYDKRLIRSNSDFIVPIGIDVYNEINNCNLLELPHLLIGGSSCSGKTTILSSLIIDLLLTIEHDNLKLILIDTKPEGILSSFNGISSLVTPVIKDPEKAITALDWAKEEIDRRFRIMIEHDCNTLKEYNSVFSKSSRDEGLELIRPVLIIIDELHEIMDLGPEIAEEAISWIAKTGRAAGIHMIITSSSDSSKVLTGLIKANIPSRIVLKTDSSLQSKHFFDFSGAEKLSGFGDMLFLPYSLRKPVRLKGFFVEDQDIRNIVEFIKKG